jgi:hypothetical protein
MDSSRRFIEAFGQLAHDGIAREAQFSQNFSYGAQNFGQALWPKHDERDRKYQNDFEQVQSFDASLAIKVKSQQRW